MRKTAFAVAALAAMLSLGATADGAAAMPISKPSQLALATPVTGALAQKTALVCGRWGCRRVVRGGVRVWIGPRRPLYAFAGPRAGWSGRPWGWSSGPGWGWSSGPSWGWQRRGWGWNRW